MYVFLTEFYHNSIWQVSGLFECALWHSIVCAIVYIALAADTALTWLEPCTLMAEEEEEPII